jgi:hypothetical protein
LLRNALGKEDREKNTFPFREKEVIVNNEKVLDCLITILIILAFCAIAGTAIYLEFF